MIDMEAIMILSLTLRLIRLDHEKQFMLIWF